MDRLICLTFFTLLALPLGGMLYSEKQSYSRVEGRALASLPSPPGDLEEWDAYPTALKNYVADHFGGRQWLREQDARIKKAVGVSSKPGDVLIGRNGWLYHVGVLGRNVEQFQDELADSNVLYFDYVKHVTASLGIPLVMAMIPHKMQVYPEYVPADYRVPNSRYYQDVISQLIEDKGLIDYIDLVPVLLEEKAAFVGAGQAICFQRDTHWNMFGANAAQYAVAERLASYLDFVPHKLSLEEFVFKAPGEDAFPDDPLVNEFFSYSDRLTSMLGLSEPWTEPYPLPDFLPHANVSIEKHRRFRHLRSGDAPENRVLVVHDSGSIGLAPYFTRYFSEVLYWWTSAPSLLEFREVVRFFKPDAVLWQTSQNVIAASGFQARLPERLNEYEQIFGQSSDVAAWRNIYRWAEQHAATGDLPLTQTQTELIYTGSGLDVKVGGKPSIKLVLPRELSLAINGRRIKVSVNAEMPSNGLFQFFGIDFSSTERQCECASRLVVGARSFNSEALFLLPDRQVAEDTITIFPTADVRLEDLKIHTIDIYVDSGRKL